MLRLTLELLPATNNQRRVLGVIEIANVGSDNLHGDYVADHQRRRRNSRGAGAQS